MMAEELGASPKTARRAALLHDIGKAVSHEIEGPHALVGGDMARKHGESEAVAHAMEAHHNEVEPQTVRSEEHTSELQSRQYIVCRLLLEKKTNTAQTKALTLPLKSLQFHSCLL